MRASSKGPSSVTPLPAPMATAFVLVDAVPGMTDKVFASLDKLLGKGLVAKEKVRSENFDILVRIEASDDDALDDFVASHLRFISGIKEVRRVSDAAREPPVVQTAMQRLAAPK
jgi:hypothetical protein